MRAARWEVEHPQHGRIEVCAADLAGAIAEAARQWGIPWTRYEFHAFVIVHQISGGSQHYP